MLPYLHKLVYRTHTGQYGIIAHYHMAGHLGIIAHDAIIADDAVMGNMAVCHDQAVIANLGGPPVLASPVYSNKFTNSGIVTNFNRGLFPLIFQILRNGGYDGPGKYPAVFSYPGAFHDGYIAADPGTFPNFHVLMQNTERIYLDIGGQFGIGMNICVGMNHYDWLV
jgi:hypothetical protein